LTNANPEIPSDSDVETVNEDETNLKSIMKNSNKEESKINNRSALYDEESSNETKAYLEGKDNKEIKSIHDLPGIAAN
jgi:hypothetical protein